MSKKWGDLSIEDQIETLKKAVAELQQRFGDHIHSPTGEVAVRVYDVQSLEYVDE